MSEPLNPYQNPSSAPYPDPDWSTVESLEYLEAVRFIWTNPNWVVNLLLSSLCLFAASVIPILPQLVLMGYQCEVLEGLVLRPRGMYPDFKMDRLADYLVRGLWPFVVALLLGLAIVPIMLLVLAGPLIGLAVLGGAGGEEGLSIGAMILLPLLFLLVIAASLFFNVAMVPFLLRAALTQDIGGAFDLAFAKDFVRRMWKETLIAGLFLTAVAFAAQIVGLLLFCVGIFLTFPVLHFAQVHLGAQLYRVYLARGGEKIPLKTPATS